MLKPGPGESVRTPDQMARDLPEDVTGDKLEEAVLKQLGSLYRDGARIRRALAEAAAKQQERWPALEERHRALAEEIRCTERALDRYYAAFGRQSRPSRFQARVSALEARLDALREQDHVLAQELMPQA